MDFVGAPVPGAIKGIAVETTAPTGDRRSHNIHPYYEAMFEIAFRLCMLCDLCGWFFSL
jgi:hypothetical protein